MKSLFSDEQEKSPQDEVDKYLIDCEAYLQKNLIPSILPNEMVFAQENLSQRPGMEWLSSVKCEMIAPTTKDKEQQKIEIQDFLQRLTQEAQYLPPDFPTLCEHDFPGSKFIAMDTETTGLDTRILYDKDGNIQPKVELVCASIAISDTVGYYLPVWNTEADGILNWDKEIFLYFLQEVVNNFVIIFHNAQYDLEVLAIAGIETRSFPFFIDTQLLDFFNNPMVKAHGLKYLSEKILGRKMIEISQLFTEMGVKTKTHINFNLLPASNGLVYAVSDALNTFGLFMNYAQMPNEVNMFVQQSVPLAIDHKLVDTLRNLYRTGFPVNFDYALYACKDLLYRLHLLEQHIYEAAGTKFDIQSPEQVSVLLFDVFKISVLEDMVKGKPTKKYPQGLYSTAADVLEALLEKNPDILLLRYIVQYRQLAHAVSNIFSKLIVNSYIDSFIPYTRGQAQYSLTVIPSGRMSSSSNNGREGIYTKVTNTGNVTYSYIKGAGSCGFNTQGVTKPDKKQVKARKVLKIPEEAQLNLAQPYPKEIELELVKLLTGV